MITAKGNLIGKLNAKEPLKGKLNNAVIKVYPELEDLTVTPLAEEQHFKSEKYGYGNVIVNAVETEELSITPGIETQTKEGMFNKVTVAGDSDLIPENIKEGTEIFGVQGSARATKAAITDGTYLFYKNARIDYVNDILALCTDITSCESMFMSCNNLTELDLSKLDTKNAISMYYMFRECKNLEELNLNGLNTSSVINISYMFSGCEKLKQLDLSSFNTENVTNMDHMFFGCTNLTELVLSSFDTKNVTNMSYMFGGCINLTELDLSSFNTKNVTNVGDMFYNCPKLIDLDMTNSDFSNVTALSYMFHYCYNLTNLKFGINLGKGYTQKSNNYSSYKLNLSYCTKLTHESLMNVINGLYDLNLTYDVANGGTLYAQQLELGSKNLAKLTAEEIAIATNKRLVSFLKRRIL